MLFKTTFMLQDRSSSCKKQKKQKNCTAPPLPGERSERVLFDGSVLEQCGLHDRVRRWGFGEKSMKAEGEYDRRKMIGGGLWKVRLTSLDLNK